MSDARALLRRAWVTIRTIRVRLTLWYVLLLAAILLAFSAFVYLNLSHRLYAELDRALAAEAQQLNAQVDVEKGRLEFEGRGDELEPGVVVVLYDPAGRRVFASDVRHPLPALDEALARTAERESVVSTTAVADGSRWRVLTRPAVHKGRTVGVLQVARAQADVEASLGSLLTLLAIALPSTLLPAVAGGLFLAGRALNPIDRIVRTAERISAEDLSRRLGLPPSPDEVGRLAAAFDRMLDRLDRAFQRQRRFTADAAHELRTPLALLTAQADLALRGRRTAADYREALASVRDDAAGMSQLLGDLLTLARADAGEGKLDPEPLNLNAVADDVVAAMTPLAESRGVRLERASDGSAVVVDADQTRLTQLMVNLVDNGIKYTPAGGTVTVSADRTADSAVVRVADTGVGIAPQHLPHLFERFYRVDKARSRAEGGAGLGLAICRWIAQAHGGGIEVDSQPGRGSTFTVRLPLPRERLAAGPVPQRRPAKGEEPAPAVGRATARTPP